jgi:AbrB family looped-hinge helix DNA binding protein
MKAATRLTSKGQVVIPKPVREQLRWASGTRLAVEILGDGSVRLTPVAAEDSIDALFGCLQDLPEDPVAALEAEHRAEIEADERRQRRGR